MTKFGNPCLRYPNYYVTALRIRYVLNISCRAEDSQAAEHKAESWAPDTLVGSSDTTSKVSTSSSRCSL